MLSLFKCKVRLIRFNFKYLYNFKLFLAKKEPLVWIRMGRALKHVLSGREEGNNATEEAPQNSSK